MSEATGHKHAAARRAVMAAYTARATDWDLAMARETIEINDRIRKLPFDELLAEKIAQERGRCVFTLREWARRARPSQAKTLREAADRLEAGESE